MLRRAARQHVAAIRGDQHVVLDAHADVVEGLRHIRCGPQVQARFDRQHHAGLQPAPWPLAAIGRSTGLAIVADIVHVEPEPVSGAMHVELSIRPAFQQAIERTREQSEVDQSLRQHAHRRVVRCDERSTRSDLAKRCRLRRQH